MGKTLGVKKIVSGEADLFADPIIVPPFQNIDVFIGFGDGFDPDPFPGRLKIDQHSPCMRKRTLPENGPEPVMENSHPDSGHYYDALEDYLAASSEIRIGERSDISRILPLRQARMCYDHLAGRLGVVLAEKMQEKKWVFLEGRDFKVTSNGRDRFEQFGIDCSELEGSRRLFARRCIDWSERKPHIGGVLGAALASHFMKIDWIRRSTGSRVVFLTNEGRRSFMKIFEVDL